ncbi:peptidylprolyl isomerase [Bacillus kwashiorkori]|uniref:peptidylprolyl isomerase n=1 Tax=Bacillus kwashiorkori TaxID=1522318 RepID=UPI000782A479|nr:peptidylprolyl isomerase [Bacillus kwashiorkori]
MKKKLLLSVTLAAGILTLSACGNGDNVAETKAGNITQDEFYQVLKERYGEATLQELVYEKVLADKYEVTDKEVEAEIETFKEQLGESYSMFLAQYGIKDDEQLKDILRMQLLQEKAVLDGQTITDEELQEQYNMESKTVTARHILVADENTAKEVLDKLNNGEKFEDLAKEYSTDGTKDKGGDLGVLDPNSLDRDFAVAAFKLKEGEVSSPVKSQFGYHIIEATKVEDKKDVKPFAEMKSELEDKVKQTKVTQTAVQDALNKLVKDSNVKINDKDLKDLFKAE